MKGVSLLQTGLMGNFSQTMDTKGRMSFPQKLRDIIGDKFIITNGIDGCLFVYSLDDFERIARKLGEVPMSKANSSPATPSCAIVGVGQGDGIMRCRRNS